MTDAEVLAEAIRRTGHRRFAELLDPSHPDYNPRYWRVVRKMAGVTEPPPVVEPEPDYPSVVAMAGNAAKAAAGFAASGFKVVDQAERERRLDICRGCAEFYDEARGRCRHSKCGCVVSIKVRVASQHCPVGKW